MTALGVGEFEVGVEAAVSRGANAQGVGEGAVGQEVSLPRGVENDEADVRVIVDQQRY